MKQRFTEEQIIKIIQEAKGGLTVKSLCRKYAIASATYYRWKNKFDGLTLSEPTSKKDMHNQAGQNTQSESTQSMPACGYDQVCSTL